MNEFRGTKGEWMLTDIDHCAQYGYPIEVLGDSYPIADVNLDSQQTEAEWKANAQLISKAPELLAKLQSIVNISEDKGIEGCTWGDTDMSSTDVVFGYNLALEYVKGGIEELIKQATEV